jgi:Xaa-Pro aminopeptidase
VIEHRRRFISQLLDDQRLDALLIFGRSDMRYLCGFTGTDGVLLLSRSGADFLTDSRYQEQARQEVRADRIHCYKNKLEAVGEELVAAGFQRIGFDARDLTVAQYDLLKRAPTLCHLDWTPLADQLETLRSIKDADELDLLRQAALLNRQAFETVLPHIRAGVSEREVALELEFCLKKLGGGANAFDFIVASGTRGALPHGVASTKKIMAGELVTIDFGTRWDGYHSDETVTLAVGEVDGKLRQIFDIVLEAHDCAMAAVRPGLRACDLDAVARDLITAKGYGDFFGHGLGHGVGLQVHEYPALTTRNLDELLPGMVITIEPGIYLPGIGGVRIEDTIVVTADGYECLTSIPKQFRMLAS